MRDAVLMNQTSSPPRLLRIGESSLIRLMMVEKKTGGVTCTFVDVQVFCCWDLNTVLGARTDLHSVISGAIDIEES